MSPFLFRLLDFSVCISRWRLPPRLCSNCSQTMGETQMNVCMHPNHRTIGRTSAVRSACCILAPLSYFRRGPLHFHTHTKRTPSAYTANIRDPHNVKPSFTSIESIHGIRSPSVWSNNGLNASIDSQPSTFPSSPSQIVSKTICPCCPPSNASFSILFLIFHGTHQRAQC